MNSQEAFSQQVHSALGQCAQDIVRAGAYLQEGNTAETRKKYYAELFLRLINEANQMPVEQRPLLLKFINGLKKKVGLI